MSATPMEIEVQVQVNRRLEDRLAAQAAGKSLQIVVPGKCRVCKRRSATVPATKTQAMNYFGGKTDTVKFKGFKVFEVRMLKTGVHRDCQKVEDQKKRDKAAKRAAGKARQRPVVLAPNKIEAAIARRNKRR